MTTSGSSAYSEGSEVAPAAKLRPRLRLAYGAVALACVAVGGALLAYNFSGPVGEGAARRLPRGSPVSGSE